MDVAYLLLTSLEDGLLSEAKEQLLSTYRHALNQSVPEGTQPVSVGELRGYYELSVIDFLRFALGDGALIEADVLLCGHVHQLLEQIDGGNVLDSEGEYYKGLQMAFCQCSN